MSAGETRGIVTVFAANGIVSVTAAGECDLVLKDGALSEIKAALDREPDACAVFDLRAATMIDSCFLGLLVVARKRLGAGRVFLVRPEHPQADHPIRITGLDRVVTPVASLSQAYALIEAGRVVPLAPEGPVLAAAGL